MHLTDFDAESEQYVFGCWEMVVFFLADHVYVNYSTEVNSNKDIFII